MIPVPREGLEAFAATCPDEEEVVQVTERLGLTLEFHLPEKPAPRSSTIPGLPAQYHFRDVVGTECILLLGRDQDPEGRRLPPHACRLWLYTGRNPQQMATIALLLAAQWQLSWQAIPVARQAA